jgi:hypothetical protein
MENSLIPGRGRNTATLQDTEKKAKPIDASTMTKRKARLRHKLSGSEHFVRALR